MERYLTKNSTHMAWWEIPNTLLSALLISVCMQVLSEDIAAKSLNDPFVDGVAYATVFFMMLLPLLFAVRRMLRRRMARRIARALSRCDEPALPIARLDAVTGVRGALRKIERLLDKGFLRRLEPDVRDGVLWLDNPRPTPEPAPEQPDAHAAVLEKIRALNDAIDDADVSERIERIEALTVSIFDTVRQRPERADDARRFVNYYLPTTLRLLETYRLMEGQSYQGQTIRESRGKIEDALDQLVSAIEQQQDRLFRSEALDVEAEIQVLETMMRSDGSIK